MTRHIREKDEFNSCQLIFIYRYTHLFTIVILGQTKRHLGVEKPDQTGKVMTLHDFLVEHAKFPFPVPDESRTDTTSTDISVLEVSLLDREWKAGDAVRDATLVQKLCRTLETILCDTPVAGDERYLLSHFSPLLQFDEAGGEDRMFATNPGKAHVRFHLLQRKSKSH